MVGLSSGWVQSVFGMDCAIIRPGNSRPNLYSIKNGVRKPGSHGDQSCGILQVEDDLNSEKSASKNSIHDGPLDSRTIIGFHHVDLHYKDQAALSDITFSVSNGEFVCLTGPSGSGKSSILRLVTMDAIPTNGQVIVRGMMASKMNRRKIPTLRREIGFVFQDFRLLEDRSVEDNVAFAQLCVGVKHAESIRNVMRVLTQVGLWDKRHRLPCQLSGGEQQRVAIARAMVNSPKILLADEPTGNLDPVTAQEIFQLLFRINDSGTCVIFSTHDHEVVKTFGQRVLLVEEGRLVSDKIRTLEVDRGAKLTSKMYQPDEVVPSTDGTLQEAMPW
jgi:cell division transport system ATP-binding protein